MMRWTLSLLLLASSTAVAAGAQAPPAAASNLGNLPGFLVADRLGIYDRAEHLTMEVNLQGPLVAFVAEAAKAADPDLAAALAKIKSVVFQLYKPGPEELPGVRDRTLKAALALDKLGWQRVVFLRQEQNHNFLYLKLDGNRIVGLTALFVDREQQFGFINIAGEVDPAQIGRIGQKLNIQVLEEAEGKLPAEAGAAPRASEHP